MKYFFSSLALLLISSLAFSQKPGEPFPGYSVSNEGDTIRGGVVALKRNGNIRPSFQMKFEDESTKAISPKKYKYVLAGEMEFESYEIPGNADGDFAFFYKKSSGEISLYEYQYEVYELNKTVWKSEFYIKNGKDLERLTKSNFTKRLPVLFASKPEVVSKVKDTKFEDVFKLFDEYNDAD